MVFTGIKDLFNSFIEWFQTDVPPDRLKGDTPGRKWFLQSIGYDKSLLLADLNTLTDRSEINDEIVKRIPIQDVNKNQGISALKLENSTLYSFQKCVVAREKTRIQYYRDDLSQKGKRNLYAVKLSYDEFDALKTNLDTQGN